MTILTLANLISLIVFLFMGAFIIVRNPRTELNLSAAAVFLSFAVWSLGLVVLHLPELSKETARVFLHISTPGWTSFASSFLWFALQFSGERRIRGVPLVLVLTLPTLILTALGLSGFLINDLTQRPWGYAIEWSGSAGDWLFFGYYTIYMSACMWLLLSFRNKQRDRNMRRQAEIIVATTIPVIVAGTFTNFVAPKLHMHDVPAIAHVIALVWASGIFYAAYKYKLFVVTPATAAHNILQVMSESLFLLDPAGLIVTINRAALKLTGHSKEALLGRSFESLVARYVSSGGGFDELFAAETFHAVELRLVVHGGRRVPVRCSGALLREQAGRVAGMVLVVADITERIRAEEERLQSLVEQHRLEEQLQQSQKMEAIGTLAGGVAHDINNVLGAVLGFASALKFETNLGDDESRDVDNIVIACQRGRDLTRNLLGFARKGKYVKEKLSLNEMIHLLDELLSRTVSKRVEIDLHLEKDIKPIEGDRSQLNQALMNVCINAVDAMNGRGRLEIETDNLQIAGDLAAGLELPPGRYVRISMSDTGKGMSRETMSRAFEPFFTTKSQGEGTGLGLSMVYGTIRNHGGAVTLESEDGRGTSVSIFLPAAEGPLPSIFPRPEAAPATSTESGATILTILLVDDEPLVRSSGLRLLRKLGYEVLLAEHGEDAIREYEENRDQISLVILDLMMPVMDGREAFMELRRIDPNAPVLLASGYSVEEHAAELIEKGALGFLEKPFNLDELAHGIASAMSKSILGSPSTDLADEETLPSQQP